MQVIISNRVRIPALFFLLLVVSCRPYNEFYFVKNQGAIMPVKVRGNAGSQTYIILLPGGPAGDGMVYSRLFKDFTRPIEAKYKMVYYDQRGAGNCQGVYPTNTLNLEQLGEDLDKIIKTIEVRDPKARVYLMGYSYGGTLGMTYLKHDAYQQKIAGFISISGAFDRKKQEQNRQLWVEYLLEKWVSEGEIESYEAMKTGYHCNDAGDVMKCREDSIKTVNQVQARLDELAGYNRFKLTPAMTGRLLGYTFFSQSNPIQSGITEGQNGKYFQEEFDRQLLSEEAGNIRIPVLLINGRYDTNVPFFEAEAVYGKLGTPAGKKSIAILENSGHLPMVTEPEALSELIIRFIDSN